MNFDWTLANIPKIIFTSIDSPIKDDSKMPSFEKIGSGITEKPRFIFDDTLFEQNVKAP